MVAEVAKSGCSKPRFDARTTEIEGEKQKAPGKPDAFTLDRGSPV
jgi:hypothetical protein